MHVRIKRGDTRPLDAVLRANRLPVNLTGATVRFNMKPQVAGAGSTVVRGLCTILGATDGKVRYSWLPADVDGSGIHDAEFEVTFGDGTVESFPNEENFTLEVVSDLG